MNIDQQTIDNLQAWNDLSHQPPLDETVALRYADAFEQNTIKLSEETVSKIYALVAFHRMKRTTLHEDAIAKEFVQKARDVNPSDAIIDQLFELVEVQEHIKLLKDEDFRDLFIHETDHQSVKRKKLQLIHEKVEKLEEEWSTGGYSLYRSNSDSQIQVLLKNGQEAFDELLKELEPFLANQMNGVNHVSATTINQWLRKLESLTHHLESELPEGLQDQKEKNPLSQLDDMVGLDEIKSYIHRYYHYLKYQQQRKDIGFHMNDEPELHMIITGNPGTGKTTLARLLANIYYDLGLLDTKEVIEVNRSHLVGSYVGQTEENTMNYVQQAIGGILFIDEAYSLKREGQSGNDYGQAAIDTLVSAMTSKEYGDKFAVILAGYPEEMRQFLWANPGLRSRFPEQNHMTLPNYNLDELVYIGETTALENDYFLTEKSLAKLETAIEKQQVDDTFGNARTVRNIILQTIFQKGATESGDPSETGLLDFMRIEGDDFDPLFDQDKEEESPIHKLERLIGLQPVKDEVKKLSSFVRLQQRRKEEGLPSVPIQLHAVFSGNPGTGKTTVAHIYAQILKNCGLLKRGHVVVASRSDLVAGYIGQTTMKTKKKIREALGGVLFIDEAYSLFKSGSTDFGKEAIDTLVDEMTKHNENLVVILAGYKQEMKALIQSNPGLSSRFKKFFHFPDYTADELVDITLYQAKQYQYELSDEAITFLTEQYKQHSVEGNGRFVKNLVDESIQYQALRIDEAEQIDSFHILSKDDVQNAWNAVKGREI
ncbi:AAA family ATPase [Pontibacillus sp. HMF3514]|uniref:AAA family ATPase n=1 Tax=Pontibacillus sp. HMF3514 TaxID=2692425 RepID=UPI00132006FE|nr:AAA family ATPase [Pontibacillus sp. HMF3514]QHE52312.1 AAA family ATPase [Pontibacillus sp. HMF3514]